MDLADKVLASPSRSEPSWSPLDDLRIGHRDACPAYNSRDTPCTKHTSQKNLRHKDSLIKVLQRKPLHRIKLRFLKNLAKICVCDDHVEEEYIDAVVEDWKYYMAQQYGVRVGEDGCFLLVTLELVLLSTEQPRIMTPAPSPEPSEDELHGPPPSPLWASDAVRTIVYARERNNRLPAPRAGGMLASLYCSLPMMIAFIVVIMAFPYIIVYHP